jgi:hypothetical protein
MPVIFMILGFIVGYLIASYFIFPAEVLNIELAHLTIGNLLRIVIGVIVFLVGGGVGLLIGSEIRINKNPES